MERNASFVFICLSPVLWNAALNWFTIKSLQLESLKVYWVSLLETPVISQNFAQERRRLLRFQGEFHCLMNFNPRQWLVKFNLGISCSILVDDECLKRNICCGAVLISLIPNALWCNIPVANVENQKKRASISHPLLSRNPKTKGLNYPSTS